MRNHKIPNQKPKGDANTTFFRTKANLKRTPMTRTLGRRLDQFQSKVQQRIVLADDEIGRCQEYLDALGAEIAEYEDRQRKLQIQSEQRLQERFGQKQKRQLTKRMQAAAMASAHNATLAELAERHRDEYDSLHQDFELQLSDLQKYLQQRIDQKVGPIDEKIGKASASIAKLREQITEAAKHADTAEDLDIQKAQQMECERTRVLEQTLQDSNKERLNELLQARQDLGECVRTLEELEEKHETEMGSMKQRLETQTMMYEEKFRVAAENHNKRTDALRRRVQEAETKARHSHMALKRLEKHFSRELSQVVTENEQLKRDMANVTTSEINKRRSENEIQEADAELQKVIRDLQNRDELLAKAREDSQRMKREVARINHEAAIAKRRAALNLI
jgi:hypothetical protein